MSVRQAMDIKALRRGLPRTRRSNISAVSVIIGALALGNVVFAGMALREQGAKEAVLKCNDRAQQSILHDDPVAMASWMIEAERAGVSGVCQDTGIHRAWTSGQPLPPNS